MTEWHVQRLGSKLMAIIMQLRWSVVKATGVVFSFESGIFNGFYTCRNDGGRKEFLPGRRETTIIKTDKIINGMMLFSKAYIYSVFHRGI